MYNIFKKYDPFIERYQTKTWIPTNNTQLNTPNKDTIFKINNNDNFLDIKRTKFYINGRYLQKDGKEYPKDSKIQLIDNPIPSLFSKVVVKIRGKTINEIEYVGRVSTIKGVISYSLDLNGPTINSGFVSNFKGGGTFCALGNISQLGLPFFKDYPYPLFNCDIEICFTRNTDDDALLKKDIAGTADGKIIIDEFTIKTQIIEYNPLQNVLLINELNKISLEKMYTINCKAWQCIEERNITGKTIKINLSNQYRSEKHPVFCGFVFQTNKLNTQDHDPGEFDHCKLRNYRFEINGISYPAERQDEDFNNNKFCQSYEDSMVYKLTYHKNTQELPLMYDDPIDFKNYRSIFLTKTAYHPINISANKKNIILHIELHEDIPKDTICYIFFIREDEFLFDMEKVKRNPKGKFVSSDQKQIIINAYKTKIAQQPNLKKEDLRKILSNELGIGQRTISTTIYQYENFKTISSPNRKKNRENIFTKIDDFDKNAIRRTIHGFWFEKQLPTLDKILSRINTTEGLPQFTRTTLYSLLRQMGFKYQQRIRNSAMIERDEIVVWRRNYLEYIKRYRKEGRPIYYMDETWVNAGDCNSRIWVDKTVISRTDAFSKGLSTGPTNPSGKGKRLIVVHIGNEDGFVPGGLLCFESKKNTKDYHDEMNGAGADPEEF
ncbi:hypothetical protein QTP88_015953 [Uroleucon formosanum]